MKKQDIKYWVLILLVNYVPSIGFHLALRPMWTKEVDDFTNATLYETVFTILFLPIYLVLSNYLIAKKFEKTISEFIINTIIIFSCILISQHLHFANWADSIGSWSSPDLDTLEVAKFERSSGIIISLIGVSIVFFRLWDKKRKNTNNNATEY